MDVLPNNARYRTVLPWERRGSSSAHGAGEPSWSSAFPGSRWSDRDQLRVYYSHNFPKSDQTYFDFRSPVAGVALPAGGAGSSASLCAI